MIIPTRGRPDGLRRLLDSIRDNAAESASIEVIAVIDADDLKSLEFAYSDLRLERVGGPPARTMGALNLAGYQAARGRYLMLLNDDVVVRTPGWDTRLRQVLEHYPDGIVLVHVNDLIFRDTLCTSPLLTREFCKLAGGICMPEYRRYRIDDHIHHVYDLIRLLGYTGRVFLPDVIFEHRDPAVSDMPDPAIQALDHQVFESFLEKPPALGARLRGEDRGPRCPGRETRPPPFFPGVPGLVRSSPSGANAANQAGPAPICQPGGDALLGGPCHRRGPLVGVDEDRAREDRSPNLWFDVRYYAAQNPAVASRRINPLEHFLTVGMKQGCSPSAGATLPQYLRRLAAEAPATPLSVNGPVPISVIVPTRNREHLLARMLESCRRHTGDCELELVIIDDGSTGGTSKLLRELAAVTPDLRWQSVSHGGPARARDLAASIARHDVLLFVVMTYFPLTTGFSVCTPSGMLNIRSATSPCWVKWTVLKAPSSP